MDLKRKLLSSSFVMLTVFFLYLVFVNRMAQKPAPNLTLKQTFDLLKKETKIPDLVYMAFDSQIMKNDGKTRKFLITGCSPSRQRTYYLLANGEKLNPPRTIETKACKPTLPYEKMMDSPQVLARITQVTGKTCHHRVIYKMDWNDPVALILCWDSKNQVPLWQVEIDTVTGKVKAIYPKKPDQKVKTSK